MRGIPAQHVVKGGGRDYVSHPEWRGVEGSVGVEGGEGGLKGGGVGLFPGQSRWSEPGGSR